MGLLVIFLTFIFTFFLSWILKLVLCHDLLNRENNTNLSFTFDSKGINHMTECAFAFWYKSKKKENKKLIFIHNILCVFLILCFLSFISLIFWVSFN